MLETDDLAVINVLGSCSSFQTYFLYNIVVVNALMNIGVPWDCCRRDGQGQYHRVCLPCSSLFGLERADLCCRA